MAVTQQLARLTTDELARCRRSAETLHLLCSFELREPRDYLDLDWSPRALQRAAVLAGLPGELVAAIERACDGDDEINPAYRDHARTIREHPVTALEPDVVRAIAAEVQRWSAAEIVRRVPDDPTLAARALGLTEMADRPREYLGTRFALLREFYAEANTRHLATAMWWD